MEIAVIIQARMSSTRLPGKVMEDIQGKPMLWHVIQRLRSVKSSHRIIIATTDNETDKPILNLTRTMEVDSYAGSEDDVLDRYYQAAKQFSIDVIVRITADCPLLDPRVADIVIQRFLEGSYDYASNTIERTYPDGLDVEVFSFDVLARAWEEAMWTSDREHVTPYIWNNPDKFKLESVTNSAKLSSLRWTVDTDKDMKFVQEIYKRLYSEKEIFYMEDILNLLKQYPDLEQMNQEITTNEGYLKSLAEDRIIKQTIGNNHE